MINPWRYVALASILSTSIMAAENYGAGAKAKSDGIVNDWLREQWPEAKDWDIGGQFRSRLEIRENAGSFPNRDFVKGLDNDNRVLYLRTKFHIGYTPSDWVQLYAEGRDAHVLWDKRPTQPENDTFDVQQAYVRIGDPKEFPVTLKLGRQELLYGEERYVGVRDWSNTGFVFDMAKLRFECEEAWVDAFVSRPILFRDDYLNVSNDYDLFSGIYGGLTKFPSWQQTEFYFLAHNVGVGSPAAVAPGLGGPTARDIYTIGTRWKSGPQLGAWDYIFEAAGQFGGVSSAAGRLTHEAFAVNVTGGYTWKDAFGSPRVALGYDYGSGDSSPADNRHETFDLLFGTNHKLYGYADLMGLRNMHIPRATLSIKPMKDLTVTLDWLSYFVVDTRDFLFPESAAGRTGNGYARNPALDPYVGSEVDLIFTYRIKSWGNAQLGYAHFFTGDYIRQSIATIPGNQGAQDAEWFYLQLGITF